MRGLGTKNIAVAWIVFASFFITTSARYVVQCALLYTAISTVGASICRARMYCSRAVEIGGQEDEGSIIIWEDGRPMKTQGDSCASVELRTKRLLGIKVAVRLELYNFVNFWGSEIFRGLFRRGSIQTFQNFRQFSNISKWNWNISSRGTTIQGDIWRGNPEYFPLSGCCLQLDILLGIFLHVKPYPPFLFYTLLWCPSLSVFWQMTPRNQITQSWPVCVHEL